MAVTIFYAITFKADFQRLVPNVHSMICYYPLQKTTKLSCLVIEDGVEDGEKGRAVAMLPDYQEK